MPIRVNLKEIFPSDPQEINVDKVNFNFNKLLELGVGSTGPIGLTGAQGPAGPIGLTGPQGDRGATWWVDSGDPNTLTFTGLIDGDLYLDQVSTSFQVYQYDAGTSTWNPVVSIAAIVNAYLATVGSSPFVNSIINVPYPASANSSNQFITFSDRANTLLDTTRGVSNLSNNNILFLNNFDETLITEPNLNLYPGFGQNQYNSLLAIFAAHNDSQASVNADVGRYHIEMGSVYNNGVTSSFSELRHNLKGKFQKVYNASPFLSLTNEWVNKAKFSLSTTEEFPLTHPTNGISENGEFEFIVPKWNNEGMSPIQDAMYVNLGSAESQVERGSAFQHIVADGITISLDQVLKNATFGIAYDYSSANTKLNGLNHIMIDGNSGIDGVVILNKGLHVEGDANIKDGLAIGSSYVDDTAPTDGLVVQGKTGIGTNTPSAILDVVATASQLSANLPISRIDARNITMAPVVLLKPNRISFIDLQSSNTIEDEIHFYSITSGVQSTAFNTVPKDTSTYSGNVYFSNIEFGQYWKNVPPFATPDYHSDTFSGDLTGSKISLGNGVTVLGETTLYKNLVDGTYSGDVYLVNNTVTHNQITGNLFANRLYINKGVSGNIYGSFTELTSGITVANQTGKIYGTYYTSAADTPVGQNQFGSYIEFLSTGITGGNLYGSYVKSAADVTGDSRLMTALYAAGANITGDAYGIDLSLTPSNVSGDAYGIKIILNNGVVAGTTYGIWIDNADSNYIEGATEFTNAVTLDSQLNLDGPYAYINNPGGDLHDSTYPIYLEPDVNIMRSGHFSYNSNGPLTGNWIRVGNVVFITGAWVNDPGTENFYLPVQAAGGYNIGYISGVAMEDNSGTVWQIAAHNSPMTNAKIYRDGNAVPSGEYAFSFSLMVY
jgi:hypothetical protein